jgi:hypothetical protein
VPEAAFSFVLSPTHFYAGSRSTRRLGIDPASREATFSA